VAIVPGYGMAVAQAQHTVQGTWPCCWRKTARKSVRHSPGGRPHAGHMNVLLAEADVPYDQLLEMDEINPRIGTSGRGYRDRRQRRGEPGRARERRISPIYGMPIINVDQARTVFVLKRSMASGFAGIENPLFLQGQHAHVVR
jgi:NAD(P) transhydrogenase subunit beta